MFEAGFTCILSKSLMNTRTSREPRRASRVRGFFLFGICIKNPEAGMIAGLSGFCHAINIWDFPQ